jgi:hypothetical protein
VPALLLSAIAAWYLYRNNPLKLEGKYQNHIHYTLGIFRFASLFILFMLLIGLMIQYIARLTEKPIVVIAVDESISIKQYTDAAFYQNEFIDKLEQLKTTLGNEYDVHLYAFSDALKTQWNKQFEGKSTHIGDVLTEITDKFSDQNLSAVVLASDGLNNRGRDPLGVSQRFDFPVYTVLMGDTLGAADALIKQVRYNEVAFTGNDLIMQVDVAAYLLGNKNTTLTVAHEGKVLASKTISIKSDKHFETHQMVVPALGDGTQKYTIQVSKTGNEKILLNNSYQAFVTVMSNKQNILLFAQAAHPDLGTIKKSIETNEGYACEIVLLNDPHQKMKNPDAYSLVILHQLPGWRGEAMQQIQQFKNKNIPMLFFMGSLTGLNYINQIEPGISIQFRNQSLNEVLPSLNGTFSLFNLSEDEKSVFKSLPPLFSPFATYRISGEHDVLFHQQIGNVTTTYPLWFFMRNSTQKMGFVCAEGFWRWYLADFKLSGQQTVPQLINKSIQLLSTRKDRSRFIIQMNNRIFENEPLVIEAERYNDAYELSVEEELTISITNQKGKQFNYAFTKNNNRYVLNTGALPVGQYSYLAKAEKNGKVETKTGKFQIIPLQLELLDNVADAQLLNEIAMSSKGISLPAREVMKLKELILDNETVRPIIYEDLQNQKWIDLKWIFWLLLGLFTIEWAIRKWNGTI